MPKYEKKKCASCKKPFFPASGNQKYCKRKACVKVRTANPVGRPKARINALGHGKCKGCEKKFKKKTRNQKFCTKKCNDEYDNGGGRPPIELTPEIREKLKQAFMLDCTIMEACFYAEISYDTYSKFIKQDVEFSQKVKLWKQAPFLIARQSMVKHMQTDGNLALKYAERKKRDEFSLKTEQGFTNPDGTPLDMNMTITFVKPGEIPKKEDGEKEEES